MSREEVRPQYPIESVDNALRILLMLKRADSLRLSQISAELGVAQSTAHRLTAMLEYRGFLFREAESKAFRIGPAFIEACLARSGSLDVKGVAHGVMERLAEATGETIHLAGLDGPDVRFLDDVESTRALRVIARTGRVLPAHCTSVGKVLLAYLEPDELRAILPKGRLAQVTPHSISRRKDLEEELERVRGNGYATNSSESELGVGSVGVPILVNGRAVAAFSLAAPSSRLDDVARMRAVELLKGAAEEVAGALRYSSARGRQGNRGVRDADGKSD